MVAGRSSNTPSSPSFANDQVIVESEGDIELGPYNDRRAGTGESRPAVEDGSAPGLSHLYQCGRTPLTLQAPDLPTSTLNKRISSYIKQLSVSRLMRYLPWRRRREDAGNEHFQRIGDQPEGIVISLSNRGCRVW